MERQQYSQEDGHRRSFLKSLASIGAVALVGTTTLRLFSNVLEHKEESKILADQHLEKATQAWREVIEEDIDPMQRRKYFAALNQHLLAFRSSMTDMERASIFSDSRSSIDLTTLTHEELLRNTGIPLDEFLGIYSDLEGIPQHPRSPSRFLANARNSLLLETNESIAMRENGEIQQ